MSPPDAPAGSRPPEPLLEPGLFDEPRTPSPAIPTAAPASSRPRLGRHLLLFLLTAASIYLAGGIRLVVSLTAILLAHEMGHYLMCRRYRVDATLPFFMPAPWISLIGTFGAFIRIRAPIPHRRALFDIGIAGPLAGFLVTLPVLALGVRESQLAPVHRVPGELYLGEPLLFRWAVALLRGPTPDQMMLNIGPLGLAAWFGLFVTALNLSPIGQLDGGHVTYALLRSRAALVSRIGFWACVALIYFGPNWIVWSILLLVLGRRHPPTLNDRAPVGRARAALGLLGAIVFAVCFVPDPVQGSWHDLFELVRALRGG